MNSRIPIKVAGLSRSAASPIGNDPGQVPVRGMADLPNSLAPLVLHCRWSCRGAPIPGAGAVAHYIGAHMTQSAIAITKLEGRAAGEELAASIREQLKNELPDAIIVFASPRNDHHELLQGLVERCQPGALVGCSSAGEFTTSVSGEGLTTAIALRSSEMQFTAAVGLDLSENSQAAAEQLVSAFKGIDETKYRYRTALILVDALAGYTEELVDQLTTLTAGAYRFFGGGAGDDARFEHTQVFCGTEVRADAVVALEILSNKPIGIGARHGWTPASAPMRVTQSESSRVVSLNVAPAEEAFAQHASATNQTFDRAAPVPFFLHNIVGIKTPTGHKLRVPLGIAEDGSVVCAADVPTGATTHIMKTATSSAIDAAASATEDAVSQVTESGHKPHVALFFDCVATRLRLGADFGRELDVVKSRLGGAQFAGFNSYGQIVRSDGQFSGFHNCTAVVCVIPE